MNDELQPLLGEILDEDVELSLAELCRLCHISAEQALVLIEEGIIEPQGENRMQWRFRSTSLIRTRRALQLHQDLGVNWAGAALALELLDELQQLRNRLRRFEC